MKRKAFAVIVCFTVFALGAFSQAKPKPRPAKVPAASAGNPSGFEIRLKINSGAKMELSVVSPDTRPYVNPLDLYQLVIDLPGSGYKGNNRTTSMPKVVFEADPSIDTLDLFNPISLFPSDRTDIKILIPEGPSLTFTDLPDSSLTKSAKPDPLFLLVTVESNGDLSLNNEPMGKLSTLKTLTDGLVEIFHKRGEHGVIRGQSSAVNRSVTIKMAVKERKFRDLIAVAIAVQKSGADNINLAPHFTE